LSWYLSSRRTRSPVAKLRLGRGKKDMRLA
jgi:hypothetical protein